MTEERHHLNFCTLVPPPKISSFTCFVNVSWKNDDHTSRIGWVLELQDETIDFPRNQRGAACFIFPPLGDAWTSMDHGLFKKEEVFLLLVCNRFQGVYSDGGESGELASLPIETA